MPFSKLNNTALKTIITVSFICSIAWTCFICSIAWTCGYLLLPRQSSCFVESKYDEIYTCIDGNMNSCGPTVNYKTRYYLKEISSGVSKWACNRRKPNCDCCHKRQGCKFIEVNNEEQIGGCYPIITDSLDTYHGISNGSVVDCWIDYNDNFMLKEQSSVYSAPRVFLIIFMVISYVVFFVYSSVFLKRRCYDKQKISEIESTNDSIEVDVNYTAI